MEDTRDAEATLTQPYHHTLSDPIYPTPSIGSEGSALHSSASTPQPHALAHVPSNCPQVSKHPLSRPRSRPEGCPGPQTAH
jgi:hypothetical protein